MTGNRVVVGLPVDRAVRGAGGLLGAVVLLGLTGPAWAAGGGGLIELNRSLLVQLVNFLILLAVLYRLVYRPLVATLESRSRAIRDQLAEAQAAREEARRQLLELEERVRVVQAEAQAARERALREAGEARERLTAEARQEAARVMATAQAQVAQEVRRARGELRAEVGGLATEIAERLIRKSLTDDDHQRIVREALARIDRA